jgi:hypothetical protein
MSRVPSVSDYESVSRDLLVKKERLLVWDSLNIPSLESSKDEMLMRRQKKMISLTTGKRRVKETPSFMGEVIGNRST